jgi:hypothetical protein
LCYTAVTPQERATHAERPGSFAGCSNAARPLFVWKNCSDHLEARDGAGFAVPVL